MKASEDERKRTASEIIELGEMLFDTAIDAVEHRPVEDETNQASLIEEMCAAADEFFTALRLLLATEQEAGESNQ